MKSLDSTIMATRKPYRPRRELSDREILNGFDEWTARRLKGRGVDRDFWRYLVESPAGFGARIEKFEKIRLAEMEKAGEPQRFSAECQAIQSLVSAAERTIARKASRPGPQKFSQQHLLACVGFRFYRDTSQAAVMALLKREFPYRLLIFGRARDLPNWSTLYRFEQKLPSQDFAHFLENLRPLNSALSDLIQIRSQMQVNSNSDLQISPEIAVEMAV